MRLVNWNIERNDPASPKAASLIAEIGALSPDIISLTEAWEGSLEAFGGYVLAAQGVAWSRQATGERKVVLWSPHPWADIDPMEQAAAFGGSVSACTQIGGRNVRIVGICIPYHMASPLGQVPKARVWEQHERFLEVLMPYLHRWRQDGPVIVMGDFNRRMPRTYGSLRSYKMLEQAFEGYEIATRGKLPGIEAQTVDHVAVAGAVRVTGVAGRSAVSPEGLVRSDHFGVVVDFELRG